MYHLFFIFNSAMVWYFLDNTPDSCEECFRIQVFQSSPFHFLHFFISKKLKRLRVLYWFYFFCATAVSAAASFTCCIKPVNTTNTFPATLQSACWEWMTFQTQGATYKIDVWEHVPPRKVFCDMALCTCYHLPWSI